MVILKRIILFTVLIGFSCSAAWCQSVALMDSLRSAFRQSPTFLVRLDTRNSFITGNPASMRGVQVGYSYGEHVQVGAGFHFLTKDFRRFDADSTRLSFKYVAPFFEYSFIHKKNWQVSIPVRLGFGFSNITGLAETGHTKFVLLYEPAMSVEYLLFGYVGIGCGVAYRLMLVNNHIGDFRFNSPVYLLKFRVLFGKLYKEKVHPLLD